MKELAKRFGSSLDKDDFDTTKKLLSENCEYIIASKTISGPTEICQSYEQNMIEGRKKLDLLEWGESKIKRINDFEYYVYFTDFLTHKEKKHTHRCKQKLTFNSEKLIIQIKHIDDPAEQKKLQDYYKSVGIK